MQAPTAVQLFDVGADESLPSWSNVAVAVYFTGAVAVEALNGYLRHRDGGVPHLIGTTVEECLEMAGCIIAVAAMLRLVHVDAATRTAALRPG